MHENREISCTSWSSDQDRFAKAINQNADVNVQEKSDCAVVPVNRPNKEGQPFAEVGEGRAQTGENIVRSHMPPTQSGKRMSQGLSGVRRAASVGKQERFTALLHHLSLNLLRDSFYALKRQASPGVDGVTWQEVLIQFDVYDSHSRCQVRGEKQCCVANEKIAGFAATLTKRAHVHVEGGVGTWCSAFQARSGA